MRSLARNWSDATARAEPPQPGDNPPSPTCFLSHKIWDDTTVPGLPSRSQTLTGTAPVVLAVSVVLPVQQEQGARTAKALAQREKEGWGIVAILSLRKFTSDFSQT